MMKALNKIPFILLAVILLLAGCAPSEEAASKKSDQNAAKSSQSSSDAKSSDQKTLKTVRVAVPHTSLFDVAVPVYIAQEKGFFEEAGLKVETTFTKGGGDTVQGAIAGSIDIGIATGPQSIVAAYTRGAPLKIISAQMSGFDIFWVVKSDSPYKSYKDLAGKKIGFSSVGSSTDAAVQIMNTMLKKQNMPEMKGMAVGSPPDQITAVLTGQIDSGFASAPAGIKEIDEGKLRIAIKGSDIEEYKDVAVRVHFANANFLKQNPDAVKAFLNAMQKAINWAHSNQDETVAIWKKRADLKEDAAILKKTFDFYTPQMQRLAPLDGIDKIIEDSVKFKFIDKAPTAEQIKDLFDVQYAPVTKK